MTEKIGLIIFLLGCFGCLQEYLKPTWAVWQILAFLMVCVGGFIFLLGNNKQ